MLRRLLPYALGIPVLLLAGFVVGRLLIEFHFLLADVHEGLAFAVVVAELALMGVGLPIVRRLRRRRRRLEAPPTL